MKILVAVDHNPYSSYAVGEVSKLAANTWANIILLGVQPSGNKKRMAEAEGPSARALLELRDNFLANFDEKSCPYAKTNAGRKLAEVKKGVYELSLPSNPPKKELKARLRTGNPGKEILSEAREEECDLIVLGCDHLNGCGWESGAGVPRKVANDAPCSVLVVKEKSRVERIICCLDHDRVSQPSLEMINQMVTLYNAKLTIVGLSEGQQLKAEVEKKMDALLRFYHDRGIDPWIELVEVTSLDSFITKASRWGLMALWMGKKSILEKALPRSKVNKLIKGGDASVLILR